MSIGVIYLWFGVLKYFPNVSPAEDLAKNTIDVLTFGLIPSNVSIILLAIWESVVGLLLIANIWKRVAIIAALVHIVFTFAPLLILTDLTFESAPLQLTLLGQYIIKNLVIIAGLLILYQSSVKEVRQNH